MRVKGEVRLEMMENKLKQYLIENNDLMNDLRLVRNLELPQCYIAAGYTRNYIWDRLHGFDYSGRHNDIDVIYYDTSDVSEERDLALEAELIDITGNDKWSVKNQARMHYKNDAEPYQSTQDAMSRWPEVVTAIGARIDEEDNIHIICPHGLNDLFNLVVRQSPLFKDSSYYMERINKKEWKKQWPMLHVIEE